MIKWFSALAAVACGFTFGYAFCRGDWSYVGLMGLLCGGNFVFAVFG